MDSLAFLIWPVYGILHCLNARQWDSSHGPANFDRDRPFKTLDWTCSKLHLILLCAGYQTLFDVHTVGLSHHTCCEPPSIHPSIFAPKLVFAAHTHGSTLTSTIAFAPSSPLGPFSCVDPTSMWNKWALLHFKALESQLFKLF
jgi:hypothetical protein